MDKIKLWLVRRWVRELPEAELKNAYEWVRNMRLFNEAYEQMSKDMLDNFYMNAKQTQGIGTLGMWDFEVKDLGFLAGGLPKASRSPKRTKSPAQAGTESELGKGKP